ncbi:hypothetical protein ACWDG9_12300 [Streptomyces sp. NPDC001073]
MVLSFTSCGDCRNCRGGHPAYCATWLPLNLIGGRRADGSGTISRDGEPLGGHFFGQSSFAERALADERSLVKVDQDVPLEPIPPLGCGVQTGVGAVWNVLEPRLGDAIVVLGAGAVGLSAVMAAALTPATTIIAVDVLRQGADALAARGTLVVVGAPPFGSEVALDVNGLLPGMRIVGLTLGDSETQSSVPALVGLVKAGRLPPHRLITTYPFADIDQAVRGT